MARKITGGIVGQINIGTIQVAPTAEFTTAENQNITINPAGTGELVITKNTTLNSQSDLRFADSDSSAYVALQSPGAVTATYTITLPPAVTTRTGFAAVSDTSGNLTWSAPDTYRGGYSTQATSFSAVAFNCYFVNTTSGAVTATLPASPTVGDTIRFLDVAKTFDTNNFTVARNGNLIQGDADNLTVATESAAFELIWSGATFGWRIFSV
jgi:hypothetical protein